MTQIVSGPSRAGWHRLADYIRCAQRGAYRWRLRLVPAVEKMATGSGTVLHDGLAAFYQNNNRNRVLAEATAAAAPKRLAHCIPRGLELLQRYLDHYGNDRSFVVLATEYEVEAKFGGLPLTRKLDLVYKRSGRIWIMDHKSAARIPDRLRGATKDWSLATQELIGRATLPTHFGLPYGGFVLNLIGSGDAHEFRRQPIRFPERMLEEMPRSICWYLRMVEALKDVDPWAHPRSGACDGRFGRCAYDDLCTYGRRMMGQYEVAR